MKQMNFMKCRELSTEYTYDNSRALSETAFHHKQCKRDSFNQKRFLKAKEVKDFLGRVEKHWGCDLKSFYKKYIFVRSEKDRIYLANKEVMHMDFAKLRVNSIGLYFAQVKEEQFRLSVEGSQMIGKIATKNVVEVSQEQAKQWFRGEDVTTDLNAKEGFIILKHDKDFIGCGKVKEGKILNFLSKIRRVKDVM